MTDRKQYIPNTVKHGKQTRGETEDGTLWVQYDVTRGMVRVSSKSCDRPHTDVGTVSEPDPETIVDPL
jgi:hypothetical protein